MDPTAPWWILALLVIAAFALWFVLSARKSGGPGSGPTGGQSPGTGGPGGPGEPR